MCEADTNKHCTETSQEISVLDTEWHLCFVSSATLRLYLLQEIKTYE